MRRIKPENKLTTADLQLVHRYRANRALMRRKKIVPKLRARLEVLLPELEAEARKRGIATYLTGRRDYPNRRLDVRASRDCAGGAAAGRERAVGDPRAQEALRR